jgi:hypothetical protein
MDKVVIFNETSLLKLTSIDHKTNTWSVCCASIEQNFDATTCPAKVWGRCSH